ncbi:MAG: tRNA preQ1(34) S-adenosylmethionine ribosyltransferase-isomerase QueA [Candidatus Omnitrophota bacterium]
MNISEFDYDLPKELIAQFPLERRDNSRLLIIERESGKIIHSVFRELGNLLNPGDALVLNDAKVKPVRLIGRIGEKEIDVLLVERIQKNQYLVKANPGKKLKPGTVIEFKDGHCYAVCLPVDKDKSRGMKLLEFTGKDDIEASLDEIGLMPLPPYIKRAVESDDANRYQTVYARNLGAIAAPTAGLHFTNEILENLQKKNVQTIYLTLNVGLGTFTPVREEEIEKHKMHAESFVLSEEAAKKIEQVKRSGGKICAVGTTACRVLESCSTKTGSEIKMQAGDRETDIFIYPPFEFKVTDMLLTNFHLPKTTLLMLVCALAGKELMMKAYQEAVKEKYRFFSYGDCMLIK